MENDNISLEKIIEIIRFTFDSGFKVEILHNNIYETPSPNSEVDSKIKVILSNKSHPSPDKVLLEYNLFELFDLYRINELNQLLLRDREMAINKFI